MSAPLRLNWALRGVYLTLLVQVAISWEAWAPMGRGFPRVSVVADWPLVGSVPETGMLVVGGTALFLLLGRPRHRLATGLLVTAAWMLIAADVNRLQPWLYLYLLVLLPNLFPGARPAEEVLRFIGWTIAGTWFWSGVMKLNPAFVSEFFPDLLGPFGGKEFAVAHPALGYAAGVLEAGAGGLVLVRRTRRIGIGLGCSVHIFALAALGPWGLDWNAVVWPWNVAFAGLAVLCLWPAMPVPRSSGRSWWQQPAVLVPLALVWLFPLGNFFGHWDHFLSHSFYSGRLPNAIFYFHPDDRFALPEAARPYVLHVRGEPEYLLPLEFWALGELRIPGYPEVRVRRAVARQLCDCLRQPHRAGLHLTHRADGTADTRTERIACPALLPRSFTFQSHN